ncbi:MAG: MFS transporter [Alphaproteobacteria bacterium]|nr:MFS transporter [Alphaproteobacteria bacterium]
MSATARHSMLAPFQVRSFRFQWPADLLTSWGFEMESLILGWYILVETNSVLLLTIFASLQYLGTLIAPVYGMAGDRLGHRNVLCAMRVVYAGLATTLMTLAFTSVLTPAYVFAIASLSGLVRPSDLAMRNALVAETIPSDRLMSAMGVARTTADSARIAGSIAGAGLFAALGMGPAYVVIACFYTGGFLLTLGVAGRRTKPYFAPGPSGAVRRPSMLRDLREGLAYVWDSPASLAAMWLAFLVNFTAFPLSNGLLPYVAREIYRIDQTGLGYLVASFACGGLTGSIVVSLIARSIRPARMMLVFAVVWYCFLLVFVHMPTPTSGGAMLALAGFAQSLSMIPMAVMLLHSAGAQFRGRVMGVRMLAVYGLPLGLLAAGSLIERMGWPAAATLFCVVGLGLTLAIGVRWRADLWPVRAAANAR